MIPRGVLFFQVEVTSYVDLAELVTFVLRPAQTHGKGY